MATLYVCDNCGCFTEIIYLDEVTGEELCWECSLSLDEEIDEYDD